tara:strand:- start:10651 stop:11820 length:1170 start_codon:yes stop_codon:yes gene_type:complete
MVRILLFCLIASFSQLSFSQVCVANITVASTNNPSDAGEVIFTNASSGLAFTLTTGDGANYQFNSSNSTLIHSYMTTGTFTYCVITYDSIAGCSDTYCDDITVTSVIDQCFSTFFMDTLSAYNDVDFYLTSPISNVAVTHFWDFGDGTTSSLANPTNVYAADGYYQVCHTVTSSSGSCSSTSCLDSIFVFPVVVPPPPPPTACSATFLWYQDSSTIQTINVINYSSPTTGSNIVSYLWDFGDGTTSSLQFPTHTYAALGIYNLCLTIVDNSGCSSTYCENISISFKMNGFEKKLVGFTINVYPPGVASVEENKLEKLLKVYPNPGFDILNVSLSSSNGAKKINIVNLMGQVVYSENLNSTSNELDIRELKAGLYYVIVEGYKPFKFEKR